MHPSNNIIALEKFSNYWIDCYNFSNQIRNLLVTIWQCKQKQKGHELQFIINGGRKCPTFGVIYTRQLQFGNLERNNESGNGAQSSSNVPFWY
jgi:hypothetical protein